MRKLPYEHMGKSVLVFNQLVREYVVNGNWINWRNHTRLEYGWLVGFRTVYEGIHHLGTGGNSGHLQVLNGVSCALICINPRHKPIYVALNQYKITTVKPDGKGGEK